MNTRDEGQAGDETLAERLRARVRAEGGVSFRDWMHAALYDAREGYYRRRDLARWGRAGDYRTGPERSRLFAATFARYFASLHEELESPSPMILLEAGAGAGDFARGVLETLARDWPRVFDALRYVVDEVSADARSRAAEALKPFAARVDFQSLAGTGADEPGATTSPHVIFANELLDAFPVHRVRWRGGRLFELFVTLDERGGFAWDEREPSTPRLAAHFERAGVALAEGQAAEVNLEAEEWVGMAAAALAPGGYLLLVDYGAEASELYGAPHRQGGTLRGFSRHAFAEDVLARPGEQDLTTTVNWTQARAAGERGGLRTVLFERQDAFLLRAGFLEQLERETRLAADEAEVARLRLEAREMILPGGMGEHFQVLVQRKIS